MESSCSNTILLADGDLGAGIAQTINGQYTFLFATIALVFSFAMLFEYGRRRHSKLIVSVAVFLTLMHPVWTVSATSGDLGYGQRDLALLSTLAVVVLFFVMYFRQPVLVHKE